MNPFAKLADALKRQGRKDLADTIVAVGVAIDESDILSNLVDDALRKVAERYQLSTKSELVRKPE